MSLLSSCNQMIRMYHKFSLKETEMKNKKALLMIAIITIVVAGSFAQEQKEINLGKDMQIAAVQAKKDVVAKYLKDGKIDKDLADAIIKQLDFKLEMISNRAERNEMAQASKELLEKAKAAGVDINDIFPFGNRQRPNGPFMDEQRDDDFPKRNQIDKQPKNNKAQRKNK